MTNGYYIIFSASLKNIKSTGVEKKIFMQIKELEKISKVSLLRIEKTQKWGILDKINNRFVWGSTKRDYVKALEYLCNPSFIYVRKELADYQYMQFLQSVHKKFPRCIIIVEIFTYPYDKDILTSKKMYPFLLKDRFFRKQYKKYVNRFVTYSDDEEIFGVKTIRTMNGVDVHSISCVTDRKIKDGTLHLIFVGYMQRHHGLERLIVGIGKYYKNKTVDKKKNIMAHIVGDGPMLSYYVDLSNRWNVNNHIIFYGKKTGKELDRVYDLADIGVSSLGLYKIGISCISTLKLPEYLSKGLPVVSGSKSNVFELVPCNFNCQFSNSPEPLDVNEIIEFYEKLMEKYGTRENLVKVVRKYAEKYVDNSVVMEPIIQYIQKYVQDNGN